MIRVTLADGKVRELQHMVSTSFWGPDGKPISAEEFLHAMFGTLPSLFKDEAELQTLWSRPDTRRKLLAALQEKGFAKTQLEEFQTVLNAQGSDLYDVLAYIAFHSKIIERSERAERAKFHLGNYNPKQQAFLDFVLMQYVKEGVDELDEEKLSKLLTLKYHSISDAKIDLGEISSIRNVFINFQPFLFIPNVRLS